MKDRLIQWFIQLIKRDMKDYEVNKREKNNLYCKVRQSEEKTIEH